MTEELITLSEKVKQLEAELNSLKSSESSRLENDAKIAFDSLIAEAQSLDTKLSQRPTLTIAARPKSPRLLTKLFGGPESSIVQILDAGVEDRSGGFGLSQSYQGSKNVRGQYKYVSLPGRELRLIAKYGSCVFIAAADSEFLSWAMRGPDSKVTLNPIALTEYVYSVAIFMRKLAEASGASDATWNVVSEWKNIESADRKLVIPTGRINTLSFALGGHTVDEAEVRSQEDISLGQEPAVLGYQLLKMIYTGAGSSYAKIPYAIQAEESIDLPGLYASH
jgi:hypothetical protein